MIAMMIALVVAGAVAGLLAGLLGVGGGIVLVPILFFIFTSLGTSTATAMSLATGTSLATIIPTALSSIRAHNQRGNVDWTIVKRWAGPMIAGVLVGSFLITVVSGKSLVPMFGLIAVLVAIRMLWFAKAPPLAQALPGTAGQGGLATVIGFLSVMIGIGGGTLGVPTLTAFNVPAHVAVGTAAAFGLLIAVPGVLVILAASVTPADAPEFSYGYINFAGFALIVPLTVVMAPIGASLAARLDATRLKQVFACALGLTGLRMLSSLL